MVHSKTLWARASKRTEQNRRAVIQERQTTGRTSERAARRQRPVKDVGVSNRRITPQHFHGANGIIASSIYERFEIPFMTCTGVSCAEKIA